MNEYWLKGGDKEHGNSFTHKLILNIVKKDLDAELDAYRKQADTNKPE